MSNTIKKKATDIGIGRILRRPKTKSEMKGNVDAEEQGVRTRGKRSNSNLPNIRDDKLSGGLKQKTKNKKVKGGETIRKP